MAVYSYMAGAEPYFVAGNEVGCLLLHGFMASPDEVRWLGQSLAGRGLTVFAPRLPAHGTQPSDMARVRWGDWLATSSDGIHMLRGRCHKIFVIGHSMGGLLGLLLSTQTTVNGLGLLAVPITLRQASTRWAHLIKYVLPYTDQSDQTALPDYLRSEQTRLGEPVRGRIRYDRWATGAVGELYQLSQAARAALPQVDVPLLLVNSKLDPTVLPHNADLIRQSVSSKIIESHMLETSGHILPQESEREQVFAWLGDFVARHSTG